MMKKLPASATAFALATMTMTMTMLAGCGGSGQDEGVVARENVSGLGLDGYLARAEVFQDVNDNGTREAFEELVFTDDDGYFGYNPLTDTDYCSDSIAMSLKERHCLQALPGTYPIVVRGGYDLVSGEPFHGNMRKIVDVNIGRVSTELDIITPISTVLSYVPPAEQASIKAKFGITDEDLKRDFYNRSASQTGQTQDISKDKMLVKLTQKMHKSISAAARIAENTFNVADEAKLPQDTTSYMYESLADALQTQTVTNLDDVLADTTTLIEMMTQAKASIEARYNELNIPTPDVSGLQASLLDTDSITNVTKLSQVIDTVVDFLPDAPPTIELAKSSAKAIDVTVSKIAQEQQPSDIESVITVLSDATTRQVLLTELGKESTNVATLTDVDLTDASAVDAITNVNYPAVFTDLASKRLVFSESDVSAQQDLSALLYFAADSDTATSGTLSACVRFVDGLQSDNRLKAGGTLATFTEVGTWTQLNAGYAVALDFDIAGAKRQATIQYGGVDPQSQHIYRTDIGGDLKVWTGAHEPVNYTSERPTNDETCRTALESADPMDVALSGIIQE